VDRQTLIGKLHNKAYRDEFVASHIETGLPFQIRAIRAQREMSQEELAAKTEMAQARISLLERPGYGKFTLSTLKRLASAFDVGLVVRFVPFSELVDLVVNLSPEALQVPSFEKDPGLQSGGTASNISMATIQGLAMGREQPSIRIMQTEPMTVQLNAIERTVHISMSAGAGRQVGNPNKYVRVAA